MDKQRFIIFGFLFFLFIGLWNGLAGIVDATNSPILYRFSTISTMALTMPQGSDANPYRVARVKRSVGGLIEGHLLVSNFNKSDAKTGSNGAVIMDLAPDGSTEIFSRITEDSLPGLCPGRIGQTTGIVLLQGGWVVVGVMPAAGSAASAAEAGCLIVLDSTGKPVETFSGSLISGPWDLAVYETDREAKLFVTTVFNRMTTEDNQSVNRGSIVRLDLTIPVNSIPQIASMTLVASGFLEITGPAGLVTVPTGLGLSPRCGTSDDTCPDDGERREQVLYLVDSFSNRIAVIENALYRTTSAGTGRTLSANGSLNEPRGLFIAPNGHLLTVNRNDGIITEITPSGHQIAKAVGGQYRQTAWLEHTGALGL